jgi:hypothetical protein
MPHLPPWRGTLDRGAVLGQETGLMTTRTLRALTACAVAVAIATPAAAAEEKKAVTTAAPAKSNDPAIAEIDKFIADQKIDKSNPKWKESLPKPPKVSFPKDKHYTWVLETNKGTIKVALKPDVAPMHVSSTIYLTRLGFYDNIIFHRVIPGFMAQGGDPMGVGMGGRLQAGASSPRAPSTTSPASCRWRTRAQAPTGASSS